MAVIFLIAKQHARNQTEFGVARPNLSFLNYRPWLMVLLSTAVTAALPKIEYLEAHNRRPT